MDGVLPLGPSSALGLGVQYERDEFLGDASHAWVMRASAAGPKLLGIRSTAAFEKMLSGGGARAGTGRLRVGVSRDVRPGNVALTVGLGATVGDVWAAGSRHRRAGSFVRVSLLDVLSLSGSLGAERDPFGNAGWLGFAAFGLGLSVGPLGAHMRRGGPGSAEAAPNAVSLLFESG